jgi:hypothetical protein
MVQCAPHVPVPDRGAVCGLPPPLSLTLTLAERDPVAVGLKVTVILHWPLGGTLVPQLLVCAKSPGSVPLIVIWLMETEDTPAFVKVIGIGTLVVPTFWSPKLMLLGDNVTTIPVPESATVCGLPLSP